MLSERFLIRPVLDTRALFAVGTICTAVNTFYSLLSYCGIDISSLRASSGQPGPPLATKSLTQRSGDGAAERPPRRSGVKTASATEELKASPAYVSLVGSLSIA
jgi:hypothetical protein